MKKKKVGIALAIVLALILIGRINMTDDPSSEENNSATENATSESPTQASSQNKSTEKKAEKNEISIDESTIVDNFECRVKELNWYSASDFDYDCVDREEGYEYLVIVLSEKNMTDETKNAPMVSLLSADGHECINTAALSLYKKKYKINFGATMPYTTADAYVIYKVPTGAQKFKLQIMSNGFGSNGKYIVFNRTDIK